MKVIVVADSHGDVSLLRKKIKEIPAASLIIHLGDYDSDVDLIKEFTDLPIVKVKGNNDFWSRSKAEEILYLEGYKVFITHGHKYGVHFGNDRLYYKAREIGADIVLYGHTHYFDYESYGDVTIINPGSLSLSRRDGNSFVVLDINEDEIDVDRIIE